MIAERDRQLSSLVQRFPISSSYSTEDKALCVVLLSQIVDVITDVPFRLHETCKCG